MIYTQKSPRRRSHKIALTGYSGLVGGQIEAYAKLRGYQVVRLGRRSSDINWSLGKRLGPDELRGIDTVIHCAHDFRTQSHDEAFQLNVFGSMSLLEDADAARVRKFIFMSSMAAQAGNRSVYGQHKRETEALLSGHATILRPGLVWDDHGGGLVGAIDRLARKSPVLPVPNILQRNLAAIHNRDLAEVVLRVREERSDEAILVAHPETMSLPQLASRIVLSSSSRCKLLRVPPSLARSALAALESFVTVGSFRADSLTSLMTNPPPECLDPYPMGVAVRPFLESR